MKIDIERIQRYLGDIKANHHEIEEWLETENKIHNIRLLTDFLW
jgi:hypothetical protein